MPYQNGHSKEEGRAMITKKKDNYARYKAASIPILLCILAYVLFAPSQDKGVQEAASSTVSTNTSPVTAKLNSLADAKSPPVWPEVSLEFLDQANPLANYMLRPNVVMAQNATNEPIEVAPSATTDPVLNLTRELSNNQVKYVFRSDQRQVVMLGQQIFEKGEQLSEGIQLTEIQDDALILTHSQLTPSPKEENNLID